jgi:hypothetical protein
MDWQGCSRGVGSVPRREAEETPLEPFGREEEEEEKEDW